ncbi:MAG TPA: hypothetical protein VLK53_04845 [Gaiellaceae bacterium]|jgi:hypothetical protein|nr:hypothetical protein [Gaiellaceae bacterium]
MRRALLLLIPLAAIGFALAGCGGSKESASTTTRAAGFSTVEATTEPLTTQETTPQTTSNPTTTPTSTVALAKNCKGLADLGQKFSSAFTGASNAQDLKKEAALLKEFADKTPADIRPDFQVLAQYMTKIADAVGGLKLSSTPDAATLAKLQKLATQVDQAKLTAASAHITAWVKKNCRGVSASG